MSAEECKWTSGAEGVAAVIAEMPSPIVYGMPGGHMIQVFDALRDLPSVDTVLVREESLATVMAEAHGRLTGRPAVAMGQGAWILGNAGIGIMEAHLGSSPMVLLVDATEGGSFSHHGPYQTGMAEYGGYDLAAALRAITKRTFVALDPVQAVQLTQLAVKHATAGEPGPVAVVFHSRALGRGFPKPEKAPRIRRSPGYWQPSTPPPDSAAVGRAAELFRASSRPVLVSGSGVRLAKAETALLGFAERFDVPVVTTAAGKGTMDETHALAAGVAGAFGAHDRANAVLGDADLVVAIGTKLSPMDTANETPELIDPSRQRVIHIDVEPLNIGWTVPTDVPLVADAAAALEALATAVGSFDGQGTARVAAVTERIPDRVLGEAFGGRRVARMLSELLPSDAVVTCDAGENRLFMVHDYRVRQGGTVLQPNGGGGMGYAVPAALAAARLFPERLAVAVCGDGGFAMTLHGLMTAVETGSRMLVVVMDNQALGWVLHGQRDRPFMSTFASFDLAAIAQAMGCSAVRIDSAEEFSVAIRDAFSAPGVSVVVAKTTRDEAYHDVASSLARVDVEAIAERSESARIR